jgi:hypothetical protein
MVLENGGDIPNNPGLTGVVHSALADDAIPRPPDASQHLERVAGKERSGEVWGNSGYDWHQAHIEDERDQRENPEPISPKAPGPETLPEPPKS